MKKVGYLLLCFIAVLTIASCKKDKCNGLVCQNGGSCEDGKCQCATGFSGTNCEVNNNPCANVTCYYGGVCLTGTCICPGHTSGTDCSVLETPSKMYLTGVTVNHFHPTNPVGVQWDADMGGGNPDIYPVIKRDGIVIYNGHAQSLLYGYNPDANYDTQHKFYLHEDSIAITDVTNPNYRIELWDYDDGVNPDDSMFGFNFKPYTGIDGFPGSFSYHDTTGYNDEFEFRVTFYENHSNYVW